MRATVTVVASKAALAEEAAQIVAGAVGDTARRAARARLALSGGHTPQRLYARLASEPFRSRIDWGKVDVFWADERCVPPDDPDSNYRLAYASLLSKVPIAPERIHRMRGEDPNPERAAEAYSRELERAFNLTPGELPRFDLILLGVGADGHTASLFPGSPALDETTRLVVAVRGAPLRARLTLTLPVLNAAARAVFLVSGEEKAETLRKVLEGEASRDRPASLIRPNGELLWLVDRAAAGALASMLGEDRSSGS